MEHESLPRVGLTLDEVAESLGCCRRTVLYMIQRGELESFKVGRLRRVTPASLAEFVARNVERVAAP